MNKKSKVMCLCEARHKMPEIVGEAIFGKEINPIDVTGLHKQAFDKIKGLDHLDLYVTGLTVALLEVVKICQELDISLTCWHYDRDSGEYYPQKVVEIAVCPFCGGVYGNGWHCKSCGAS